MSDSQTATLERAERSEYHRIVWHLAWPAIALNSLQSINTLVDRKFLDAIGPDALAASGGAFSIVFILFALALAIGTGATALVSRFYGADEKMRLLKASRQSVSLGIFAGTAFGLAAYWSAPLLTSMFLDTHTSAAAYRYSIQYLRPVALAMPAMFVFNVLASCMRAVGDTRTPMYVSSIQILLHMGLNWLLMFPTRDVHLFGHVVRMPGMNMGAAGSGTAFCISAWIAAVMYFATSNRTVLGRTWNLQWPENAWMRRILRIATPAAIQNLVRAVSMTVFMIALRLTPQGAEATGAMSMSLSLESMAFMPVFGYMIAAATLVGQSLGMRNPVRAERLAWSATHQGVGVMTVVGILLFVFASPLAAVFVTDPEQRCLTMRYLQIVALSEPLFGYAMVLAGAHQGAGDTVRPGWVTVIANFGIRVPFALIFAVWMRLGTIAAWWALSLSSMAQGVMMIVAFRQGKWKEKQV